MLVNGLVGRYISLMSEYVTLAEALAVVEPLVVADDVTALINRACRRLYSRAATPGMTVTWTVTHISRMMSSPPSGVYGYIDISGNYVQIPTEFSHALFFIVNGQRRYVIPDTSVLNPSGYDKTAFIDRGIYDDSYRLYEVPCDIDPDSFDSGLIKIQALLRKSYQEVYNHSDHLPFTNLSAIKLACLSCVYEDENDLERSIIYFKNALEELESDSSRFRGPQRMNISFADEAGVEAHTNIY